MPPSTPNLILIGGGGHALVVAEAARLAGCHLAGFYDDNAQAPCAAKLGLEHFGPLVDFYEASSTNPAYIIALGDLRLRAAFLADLGERHATGAWSVIHPHASVAPSAVIGSGAFIGPRAVVHSFAVVHAHAVINTGAIVEHECIIGENAHIAPGAVLAGNVKVARQALVGIGSRVLPGIKVGIGSVVGAGAVVVQDVPEGDTVVGVPAAPLPRD